MAPSHDLTCKCGSTSWRIKDSAKGATLACYCKDCQAFARHLGAQDSHIDAEGASLIYQTLPANVEFTRGAENLGLMQFSPKGIYRWHTTCCGTPIGNTLGKPSPSFVGLILSIDEQGLGPMRAHVNTDSTDGRVAQKGLPGTVWRFIRRALMAAITGQAKQTPFFDSEGKPVVTPVLLTKEQRAAAQLG